MFQEKQKTKEMDIRQQLIQNIKAFMVAQSTLRSWQRPTSASPNNVATDASYLLMQEKVNTTSPLHALLYKVAE